MFLFDTVPSAKRIKKPTPFEVGLIIYYKFIINNDTSQP
jgi:hypothetical protein